MGDGFGARRRRPDRGRTDRGRGLSIPIQYMAIHTRYTFNLPPQRISFIALPRHCHCKEHASVDVYSGQLTGAGAIWCIWSIHWSIHWSIQRSICPFVLRSSVVAAQVVYLNTACSKPMFQFTPFNYLKPCAFQSHGSNELDLHRRNARRKKASQPK